MDVLLKRLQVDRLILTGLTTDQSVELTANDAYLREHQLYVPDNCSAAARPGYHDHALARMKRILKAATRPW